ncbi:hypothetical protein PLICBS_004100 [Purpureocillium lilacinum]|uniref:uncharacterized protein n=1 Tax=Purpureocillium lilacinum TaxID=33203 RepID=UPI002085EC9E|nr:hypothetical protein PLICBS_004100 [Purpureocillium lilacinum]
MEGTLNTREIGGYPTTDGKRVVGGRIYRSANLSQISPSDIARLQSLGINTIIDFRGPKEAKEDPDRLPLGTEYVNSPIIGSSSGDDIGDAKIMQLIQNAGLPEPMLNQVEVTKHGPYYRMLYLVSSYGTHDHMAKLSGYRPFFQKLLRLPSSSNILIHCTGGRDRTGVGIALLLKTLGVLDEVIEADFVASNRYLQPDCDNPNSNRFLNYKSANVFLQPSTNKSCQMVAANLAASPDQIRGAVELRAELLRRMFRAIDREFGSFDTFLDSQMGIGSSERESLKNTYTH